ncbi:trypsin-like peptidase domain-containing protein [Candidatus Parcubacteria bacterium]|nr:trypsin-like peptidase domain-containing protein [Candidatus Parcubacteria bacterium]
MSRYTAYLSIVCALLLAVFISVFSSGPAPVSGTATAATETPSSHSVLPGVTLPTTSPSLPQAEASATEQQAASKQSAEHQTQVVAPPSTPTPAPASSTSNSPLEASATALRLALVNIICYTPTNSILHSISGSGVMVDKKGIILTNAHVAQYFLLANQGVSCTIRTGGPAVDTYKASLMYISPEWLRANPTVLTETNPSGTGEYDFAFLAVTSSATTSELPYSFLYVPLSTESSPIGTPVTIASYGAQSLEFSQIQSDLFPTVVFDSIREVFTFASSTVDAFSLGGSAAAQEGSSGGGVADNQGDLVGILTTSTVSGALSTRTLHAITAAYIRAEYERETGQSLDLLFAQTPSTVAASFALQIPTLESILTAHLP